MLELLGHREEALNVLGFGAAVAETYLGYKMKIEPTITTRAADFFSGPLPLLLRVARFGSKRFRLAAAGSTVLGSILTRIAWVEAGRLSARNTTGARQAIGERQP